MTGILEFNENLTNVRMSTYSVFFNLNNDPVKTSSMYLALQDITSSFYPLIQILEITLRNKINAVFTKEYGKNYWYADLHLNHMTAKHFKDARHRSRKKTKDHFICEVPFGAWVNLLDAPNRGAINEVTLQSHCPATQEKLIRVEKVWGKYLDDIFTGRNKISLSAIFDHLKDVNTIRNRFSHYEPLWKPKKSVQKYTAGQEFDEAIKELRKKYNKILFVLNICCPKTSSYIREQTSEKFNKKLEEYKNQF